MVTPDDNNDHLIKQSIPLLILKDLAKHYRVHYKELYDIKAHPISITSAILVFKNNNHKIKFNLFAGNLDLLLAIVKMLSVPHVKAWVDKYNILGQPIGTTANTSKYIISVDMVIGNQLPKTKIPAPMGIDLADPDSITEIRDWIANIITNV